MRYDHAYEWLQERRLMLGGARYAVILVCGVENPWTRLELTVLCSFPDIFCLSWTE